MAGFQITIATLRRAEAELQAQLESVRGAISALSGGGGGGGARRGRPPGPGKRGPGRPKGKKRGRRKFTAAQKAEARKRMKKYWAERKAKGGTKKE